MKRGGIVVRLMPVAVVLAVCFLLSACGGGSSDSSSGSQAAETSGGEGQAQYDERLDELYEGTYEKPTAGAPNATPGKNIWYITVGANVESSVQAKAALGEAAAKLGWNVSYFDGKFESSRQLTGIQQAIAAGADGIITTFIDCAGIKTGLEQAKAAGIPVIDVEGTDCDPGLFTHEVRYAENLTYKEWVVGWGEATAAWVIAETGGEAKTITVEESDLAVTRATAEGWRNELERCSSCEVVENVSFVGADFGPPLQEKIEQALLQNPDANSLIPAYDAVLTSGGAAALRASGRLAELKVAGGEGSTQGIEEIYDGTGMQSCTGIDAGQEMFGAIDALVRIFGDVPIGESNTGIGWQVCDKENNLPPKGESYQPPYDYRSIYYGYWGV